MKQDNVPSNYQMNMKPELPSFAGDSNNYIQENGEKKHSKLIIIVLSIITLIIVIIGIILAITLKNKSNKKFSKFSPRTNAFTLYPNHIDGIAGEKYYISLEINEKNKCLEQENITLLNSYGLNKSQLIINFELNNDSKCSYNISLLQYNTTNINENNILIIKYNNKIINESISLNIKNAGFDKLKYISGPTQGNVLNPPNITFAALDKYGNFFLDIFNQTEKKFLNELTKGSLDDKNLEKNIYLYDERYIKIQYKSTKTGNITITSPYFKGKFEYGIKSGPMDLNNTFIEIINFFDSNLKYIIYPKDIYGNDIDDINLSFLQHLTSYTNNSKDNNNIQKCILKNNIFECELPLSKDEIDNNDINNIKIFYDKIALKCINCKRYTDIIDLNYSYAEIKNVENYKAGDIIILNIFPKNILNNSINLTNIIKKK